MNGGIGAGQRRLPISRDADYDRIWQNRGRHGS
jgi:hypothetical protein